MRGKYVLVRSETMDPDEGELDVRGPENKDKRSSQGEIHGHMHWE
jgi:hypothetical protein